MHRQFKFIWPLLVTVASFAQNTTLVTESGTIVVFSLSKNEIAIAADSRQKRDSGKYHDHACKIIALSDKFVFTSSGMAGLWGENVSAGSGRITLMDANEEAEIAFDSLHPGSDDLLPKVALLWARHVSRIFEQAIKAHGLKQVLGDIPQGSLLVGYFLGASPKSGLVSYMENINLLGSGVSFDPAPKALSLTDSIIYGSTGITDTVAELLQGKAAWVRQEDIQWERQLADVPKNDREVLKVVRWVALTLAHHPGSNEVGGPIDSLTIAPVSGVRWHNRKDECHAKD